tara:strand:+ start:669 stop:1481 length:813 start_codon:yes stop_codon:yes gene_type:complete
MTFADLTKKQVRIALDLSTFCNASCPQCHRTDPNGLGKMPWLPLIKWSLDDFAKKFPPGSIDFVTNFEICGTWGDPIMSKDIGKICKYIIDNSKSAIHLNTNGGMRTPEWWKDLGDYCGNRLTVYFDVDGIDNEMHQKYRRGVDLEVVLDNMEALSVTKAHTKAFVIMFKHNQDHVHEIRELCRMYGATEVYIIKSDRFLVNNRFEFINEKGEKDVLEEITKNLNHIIQNPWIDNASKNMMGIHNKTDKNDYTKDWTIHGHRSKSSTYRE